MSEQETCMDCGGPLEPCMCRTGCLGGQCAYGCYLTTADAVKYARKWIERNEAERGAGTTTLATERDIRMWCRAVLAQKALLDDAQECIADRGQLIADRFALKAALREALELLSDFDHFADARIAELRRLT